MISRKKKMLSLLYNIIYHFRYIAMQRILAILIMMVLCGTIHAQSTWTTEKVEADELRGIEGGESYIYSVDSIGTIKIADWKKDRITITTNEGVFAYTKNQVNNPVTNMSKVVYVSKVLIGLYDTKGVLQEKLDGESYFDDDSPKSLLVVGKTFSQSRQIKRMLKAVQSGGGCLRIVCKRKDMPDFDIKTTLYKK